MESTDEAPVFILSAGGSDICRLYLTEKEKGFFGFKRWQTAKTEPCAESFASLCPSVSVTMPKDALLYINGIQADLEQAQTAECPAVSEFEKENAPSFIRYVFNSPYSGTVLKTERNGKELASVYENEGFYVFDYPKSEKFSRLVSVPEGCEVYVNGVRLSASYITEKGAPYPLLSPLELNRTDVPRSTVYTVEGLYGKPEIRVIYRGGALAPFSEEGDGVTYALEGLMTSDYNLSVPAAAKVSVNGVDITGNRDYISESGIEYKAVQKYKSLLEEPKVCVVYKLSGLFFRPDISVRSQNGEEQKLTQQGRGEYVCDMLPPKASISEFEQLALGFAGDMIYYSFKGQANFQGNLNKALSHTLKDSGAYVTVRDSYWSMYWKIEHDITYNRLEVDNYISFAANAFSCDVHYDVTGRGVTMNRTDHAAGIYRLLYIHTEGEWQIAELTLLDPD